MKDKKRSIVYFGGYAGKEIEKHMPNGGYNAATNKMNYIIDLMKRNNIKVHVLGYYHTTRSCFIPKEEYCIDEKETHTYLSILDIKRGPFKKISGIYTKWMIFKSLLFLPRHTRLIVYNMPTHNGIVKFLAKLKAFDITLDIEEVFFVLSKNKKKEASELAMYQIANRYIVVNDLIPDAYLREHKKHIVIYGNYSIIPKTREKFDDGNIHVAYSGSIDSMRGANRAVMAAAYLPNNFRLHVSGFGKEEQILSILKIADEINQAAGFEKVIYHGQLSKQELDELTQQMHIGLNVQTVNDPFEAVSYPSKIAFYLSHGVNVVSSRMSSVSASALSPDVEFYEGDEPKAIAAAIQATKILPYEENIAKLIVLDARAKQQIEELLYDQTI